MIYLFKTTATMKPYNREKWWIDSGIVREITIDAENLQKALEQYKETVQDKYYITISKNAIKTKSPMYRDDANGCAIQCGYVITGKTDFNNDYKGWIMQYIDLWVNIAIITNPFEGGENN